MTVRYEFEHKPESGKTQRIADGIHWLRMPLYLLVPHLIRKAIRKRQGGD